MAKKHIIKNMLLFSLWAALCAGTIVLLVSAIHTKDAKLCTGIAINIKGVSNNFFVDKTDILNTIISIAGAKPVGMAVGSFNLKEMEAALQKNTWVKSAQLFFDNNEKLQVTVLEREPIARVFTTTGTTFYIDSAIAMLPLSDKFSARLPVFTGFPSDKKVLLKADSNLLRDILIISMAISKDSFNMAMIEQIDITAQRNFEMVPKIGNTIIVFGDAKNAVEKLNNLRLFYKAVVVKAGWNKYSEINVQYKGQVVAKRKGAEDVKADSIRTLQLMHVIADNAQRMAGDSLPTIMQDNEQNTTSNTIIQQSIERDDKNTSTNNKEEAQPLDTTANKEGQTMISPAKAILKPAPAEGNKPAPEVNKTDKKINTNIKPISKPINKQIEKSTLTETKKPKFVMPKSLIKKTAQPKPTEPNKADKPNKPINEY